MAETDFSPVPLTPLRSAIAARMTEAKQSIPHFRVAMDVEVDALIALRSSLAQVRPGVRLSLNDFIVKGSAAALLDEPSVNIQWGEGEIRQFRTADISVVTAIEGGILTPVVRDADQKSIWQVSLEIKSLVQRAAAGQLKMSEISGGSFGISNLGMFGAVEFDAIINPPQCAMLAVGAAKPVLKLSPSGEPVSAMVVRMTLSADHRAIDGKAAAQFLSALRRRLEAAEASSFLHTARAVAEPINE